MSKCEELDSGGNLEIQVASWDTIARRVEVQNESREAVISAAELDRNKRPYLGLRHCVILGVTWHATWDRPAA